MLKKISMLLFIIISINTLADNKKNIKQRPNTPNPHCIFDVIPLNSPVKESVARFLIKTPEKFDIDEVFYQVKNSGRIFEKPRGYQKINLVDGPEGKELKINVSKLPPGFYQLLVKIKDRSRKEHHFKTKFKDHAMFVIDSSLQVPMPDPKKNDATVAGIDSDNDGIRDDIQRWINEEFSSNPKLKAAMRQVAIARQLDLLSVNDKQKSIESGRKFLKSLDCLYFINGLRDGAKISDEMDKRYLNTKDRLYAEMKSNANFSGQAYELPNTPEETKQLCNFDPDSF